MDKRELKKLFRDDFNRLKDMTIPQYLLYSKWKEINGREWSDQEYMRMSDIKENIWIPSSQNDYMKLEPDVKLVTSKNDSQTWFILRVFISTMPWKMNVGRLKKFIVYDKVTGKYLGVLSIASDFISLGPRDDFIGWARKQRIKDEMLNYTAMGSSIVATQPLGFNYVGGKLLTFLLCSSKIVTSWNNSYKEQLAGITTTSLYGGYSQYNRLKHWKKLGTSKGKIPMEPTDETYMAARYWMRDNYPKEFEKITVNKDKIISRPKQRVLSHIYTKLRYKPPENNAPRGVYFCRLFSNTCDFLRKKDKELYSPFFV